MIHKLVIDGRLPSLNEYINACRTNRYAGATMKRTFQKRIAWYIREQLPTSLATPLWIEFKWYEKDKKRDLDNICSAKKFILDTLVECMLIEDDGWDYVTGFYDSFAIDKHFPRVEVLIHEGSEQ